MLNPKYLIIDGTYALTLSAPIGHNTVEVKPQHVLNGKITGAGFFKIVDGHVYVFGHSHSLGIKSKPEDATIIEHSLRIGESKP
jgi:hypothetical protein